MADRVPESATVPSGESVLGSITTLASPSTMQRRVEHALVLQVPCCSVKKYRPPSRVGGSYFSKSHSSVSRRLMAAALRNRLQETESLSILGLDPGPRRRRIGVFQRPELIGDLRPVIDVDRLGMRRLRILARPAATSSPFARHARSLTRLAATIAGTSERLCDITDCSFQADGS